MRVECHAVHNRPDLLIATVALINSNWKRSVAARLHTLEKSSSKGPYCSLLLVDVDDNDAVIGHVQLLVRRNTNDLFSTAIAEKVVVLIETVVVTHQCRGHGLGRLLMEECERYASTHLGAHVVCLSTHDKESFYMHLGYKHVQQEKAMINGCEGASGGKKEIDGDGDSNVHELPYSPPPPPPPPPMNACMPNSDPRHNLKWMLKILSD